jgi:hypothetical protein
MPVPRYFLTKVATCLVLTGMAALMIAQINGGYVDESDFPNEGHSIKAVIPKEKIIKDIGKIIGLQPSVICVSVSGKDPRAVYVTGTDNELKFEIEALTHFLEGYNILLIANGENYYIEKLDYSFIFFSNIQRDQCRKMSSSFEMAINPPSARYPLAKYSAEITF